MFLRLKFSLKEVVRKIHYHRKYVQVKLHTEASAPLTCQCQEYDRQINTKLPKDLQLDVKSSIPKKVPDYKKHVLVLSPQDKSTTELECMSHWQSKLELNPVWPYSVIGELKSHLKHAKLGSSILVNAISMFSGSIKSPKRDLHEKAHIFVLPDMKLYKILPEDIERFAYFLGEGHTKQAANHKLSFADFLRGADNVTNKIDIIPEAAGVNNDFEHEEHLADWLLICGHNQRDARCGVMGQALLKEISSKDLYKNKNIAVISHIGGHKFAGNIILYQHIGVDRKAHRHQLDALWFARVSPPNLTTLIENINTGKIPEEYYRGGLSMN